MTNLTRIDPSAAEGQLPRHLRDARNAHWQLVGGIVLFVLISAVLLVVAPTVLLAWGPVGLLASGMGVYNYVLRVRQPYGVYRRLQQAQHAGTLRRLRGEVVSVVEKAVNYDTHAIIIYQFTSPTTGQPITGKVSVSLAGRREVLGMTGATVEVLYCDDQHHMIE